MKLLADENFSGLLVQWLRAEGHDVEWIAESAPGSSDSEVLAAAASSGRILLTNDLDFGEHVFRHRLNTHGVVLLRLTSADESERLTFFQRHWPSIAAATQGHFIVVSDWKMRVRPLAP